MDRLGDYCGREHDVSGSNYMGEGGQRGGFSAMGRSGQGLPVGGYVECSWCMKMG